MKVIVVGIVAVLMMAACGDDSSDDDAGQGATQESVCQQYEELGADPSDEKLDALVTAAETTDDPDFADEVTAAVDEIEAGDDGGPAAEALAGTCG